METKLPRAVLGGARRRGFGVGGAIFQTTLRNPLASPDIIGISLGAPARGRHRADRSSTRRGSGCPAAALVGALAVAPAHVCRRAGAPRSPASAWCWSASASPPLLSASSSTSSPGRRSRTRQVVLRWLTGSLSRADWPVIGLLAVALLVLLPAARWCAPGRCGSPSSATTLPAGLGVAGAAHRPGARASPWCSPRSASPPPGRSRSSRSWPGRSPARSAAGGPRCRRPPWSAPSSSCWRRLRRRLPHARHQLPRRRRHRRPRRAVPALAVVAAAEPEEAWHDRHDHRPDTAAAPVARPASPASLTLSATATAPSSRTSTSTCRPARSPSSSAPTRCGKSTLLRGLARLLRPAAGAVLLDGDDDPRRSLPAQEVARTLGLLPQNPVTPEGVTVVDLVGRGRHPHQGCVPALDRRGRARRSPRRCELTDTLDLADRLVDELSGGQRQRVWIAMALAQGTDLLLLDEPTTYLDVAHQVEMLDLLADLNPRRGTTIVMVLHDLNLAARYADHLVAMRDGRVVASGAAGGGRDRGRASARSSASTAGCRRPGVGPPLVVPTSTDHPERAGTTRRHAAEAGPMDRPRDHDRRQPRPAPRPPSSAGRAAQPVLRADHVGGARLRAPRARGPDPRPAGQAAHAPARWRPSPGRGPRPPRGGMPRWLALPEPDVRGRHPHLHGARRRG